MTYSVEISDQALLDLKMLHDYIKEEKKQPYAKWVEFDGKRIFDVVV